MDIELRFVATKGAEITPESLRILYAWYKRDITQRVLDHAKVSKNGVVVQDAKIPVGSHTIMIEITDNKGRVGERVLEFRAIARLSN